mgnify:FL=1
MRKLFLLTALFAAATTISAKVVLPKIFASGMVMQQQTDANLWGEAKADATVKIATSWNKKTVSVKAGNDGKWAAKIQTPAAGGPYSITFNDGEKTVIDNILVGELWICSGQSNMEMPMKGFKNQPVENAVEDILHSGDSKMRLFTVKRTSLFQPATDVVGEWKEASPEAVRNFSATAYYFGRELRRMLNVPVGLIVTSWGGSSCEAWMNRDWLKAFPQIELPASQETIKSKNRTATVLYNGMLRPLIGVSMRGVIWYQGEENVSRSGYYADLFSRMIKGWREEWKEGDFPFYYCQIAPYDYNIIGWGQYNSAFLREQQAKAEKMNKNVGMACLMDAGLEYGIHPRKKQLAGMRLALLALDKTYGIKGITSETARYKDMEFKGDTAVITFERAGMWVYGKDGLKSDLFEVAGEDRVFHPAKAWIERSKLYVKCDEVKKPVAVRYAFKDWADGDLFCDGLPVSSFRTDNWDK